MEHTEYIRICPDSPCTVLLIHGIVGTPNHFRFLLPLIPQDWSVYNLLLDGHGHGVKEFGATSMKKWKAQVSHRLDQILTHSEKVVIAAHSMGTLFAISEAISRPEKIAGLFLLNVPLYPFVTPAASVASIKLIFGKVKPTDTVALAMQADSGVALNRRLWEYIPWIPRFVELLTECRRTRKRLPLLNVPTQAYQSRHDELISPRSNRTLQNHPAITCQILPNSGHFKYVEKDAVLLQNAFCQLLQQTEYDNSPG